MRLIFKLAGQIFVLVLLLAVSLPLQADIAGTVFRDYDASGTRSVGEPGVGGVIVTIYDGTGVSTGTSPQTTAIDGTYSVTGLPLGPLRVEVTLPADGSLDFLESGAAGSTTVLFLNDGDTVDVGLSNPSEYCDVNPRLAISCYESGDFSNNLNSAIVSFNYNAPTTGDGSGIPDDNQPGTGVESPLKGVSLQDVGSIWGGGFQSSNQLLFGAAVLKRQSGLGPLGLGGVYVIDYSAPGAGSLVGSFDLQGTSTSTGPIDLGSIIREVVSGPGDGDTQISSDPLQPSRDLDAFAKAGIVGLGDIEVGEDGETLWLVNLHQRGLISIDIGSYTPSVGGSVPGDTHQYLLDTMIGVPSCVDGVFRPWALEFHDGVGYLGGVCSGELATGSGSGQISFHVLGFAPNALVDGFWQVASTSNYPRLEGNAAYTKWCNDPSASTHTGTCGYRFIGNNLINPQPILSDIEIMPDGSLVAGIMDRWGLQQMVFNYLPDGGLLQTIAIQTRGDLIKWCAGAEGYLPEGSAGCPVSDPSTPPGPVSWSTSDGLSGAGEFYYGDWFVSNPGGGGTIYSHNEVGLGGIANRPGSQQLVTSAFDPLPDNNPEGGALSQGLHWMNTLTGDRDHAYQITEYEDAFATSSYPPVPGKGLGLGDLTLLCTSAPIEIGNRVWCDAPMAVDSPNGIQDPVGATGVSDTNLSGVTVDLSCNGGAVTANTITAADGSYLFNNSNVTGGIPFGGTCVLSIDTIANVGALGACNQPTPANVGSGADPGQDLRDSDGTDLDMNGVVEVALTIGRPGANDHSVDFGFRSPPMPALTASKTDVILLDGDGDGMLDGGDTLRYTAVIINTGNADATTTVFSSAVDANTSLVVGSVTTSQGTVTTGNTAGDTSVAVALGTLAMGGGSVTVTFDVILDDPVAAGVTEVTCQGLVTSPDHPDVSTDDPDDPPGNDPTQTPVGAAAELFATKVDALLVDTDFDGRVDAGDTLRYTVEVGNRGDQNATGVDFSSSVDANTSLVVGSVTTSQGTVTSGNTAGDTSVAVDIGNLAGNGATATITFDVVVDTPIPAGVTQVSCQGATTGDGGLSDDTDDPDDPNGDDDPTDTPLDLGSDFGDAPDTYTTTASPSHQLDAVAGIFLGACVDSEADGQPNIGADGDDSSIDGTPMATLGTCTGNDDEDGVSFDTMIMACSMGQVTVTSAGTGAVLNGWIDFDHDGIFDHPGEQIFSDQALTGSDSLMFAVPCDARSGGTYARFRVDSGGGLSPTGAAGDGEVEDYSVVTKGADFGDAPDTYGTLFAAGAYHTVDPGTLLYLGTCVDTEGNGQPVTAGDPSTGDDVAAGLSTLGTCTGNDDEDGVSFDTMIVACGMADVTVTASMAGVLNAWLDFGGDGMFDAGDQIFTDQALAAGANSLSFVVPCDASSQSLTYARFRVASVGGLGSGGAAVDGEVEDYDVATKGLDLGDAPDSYDTQDPATAASHAVAADTGLYLGACVDTEIQGQPVTAGNPATGDDTATGLSTVGTCTGNDDEDGVSFDTMIVACGSADITVTANAAGALDAWLDFGGDGSFDAGDQIVTNQALTAGANNLSFNVPCDAPTQSVTYARFRLSTAGGLAATGAAMDGEVEDYEVVTKGLDLGDAPEAEGYPTLIVSDGARHVVLPVDNPTLGVNVDTESDGQPTAGHDGDDNNGVDDEDGVAFAGPFVPGGNGVDVTLTAGSTGGLVSAWIDWNGDGDWDDAGEQVATDLVLAASASTVLSIAAPADAVLGATCARVRISSAGGDGPTGLSMDGEIEDYDVEILMSEPSIGLAKQVVDVQQVSQTEHSVLFSMTVENLGDVALSNVQILADLASAFAEADDWQVDMVESVDLTINPAFDGDSDANVLAGTDTLDIGETGIVLLQMIVSPGTNPGPYVCSSQVTSEDPTGDPVTDISQDGDDSDPDNDDDASDDNEPTPVVFTISVVDIPTLGWRGLLAIVLLLIGAAGLRLRRG